MKRTRTTPLFAATLALGILFARRLASLAFLFCGVAASSAFAQPRKPAPTPAPPTLGRGAVLASDSKQGVLTVKTKAGRQIQFRATGSAGPGERAAIPAHVVTVNTSILQRAQAQAFCADLQGWLNMPPPQIEGFPYEFPDLGADWTCTAVAVTNRVTGRPDWSLGFSCNCEPAFPF